METIDGIMELVTKEDLEGLATSCGVNRYNTKLREEIISKGLIRLILLGKKTSLRMLETLINEGINHFELTPSVNYSGIYTPPPYVQTIKQLKMRREFELLTLVAAQCGLAPSS